MTKAELFAQAVVEWIRNQGEAFGDLVLQGYPEFDLPALLRGLASLPADGAGALRFALAAEGFGFQRATIEREAGNSGVVLTGCGVRANEAVTWRNQHSQHPHIIALTATQNRVASTLEDFAAPALSELAIALLGWAEDQPTYGATPPTRRFLSLLRNAAGNPDDPLRPYLSLENVVEFLAAWSSSADASDGVRGCLHHLGDLLPDSELWEHDASEQKLARRLRVNLDTVQKLLAQKRADTTRRRERVTGFSASDRRTRLLSLIANVEALRRSPSVDTRGKLLLPDVLKHYLGEPPAVEPVDPTTPPPPPPPPREREPRAADVLADLLLEGETEQLAAITAEYVERLHAARNEEQDTVLIPLDTTGDRNERQTLPKAFLDWTEEFCTATTWGGFIDSPRAGLAASLEEERADCVYLDPDAVRHKPGATFSIRQRLADFESQLAGSPAGRPRFVQLWDDGVTLRTALLTHLLPLAHDPLRLLAGSTADRSRVEEYLNVRAALFVELVARETEMRELSQGAHAELLDAILALDLVQVRTPVPRGNSFKAVLLPLHPLNLWRYHRLATVADGLGAQLSEGQRRRVRELCRQPHQFLSVLYAPGFPEGRGMADVLPLSGEIRGLATFENFNNALTCADGVDSLLETLRRFHHLYPHHSRPLRVALVNPPEAGRTLHRLSELLREYRPDYLPRLRIEIFATERNAHRLIEARQLDPELRDAVEEKIRAGRLELVVQEAALPMDEILARLAREPVHVIAVFDEAHVLVRRTTSRTFYPMSPFVVRQELQSDRIEGTITLEPTSDDDLFEQFLNLVRAAAGLRRSELMRLGIEAQRLVQPVATALSGQPPGAFWFFLADRGLPPDADLNAVRLFRRTDGRRQVLLCARSWDRIEHRLRPAFADHWHRTAPGAVARLLDEGTLLTGGGVLGLLNDRSQTTDPQIRGFLGMVIAARALRARQPDALLCSVDSELARLWLRLDADRSGDRCDLLTLHEEDGRLVVECIEVKTRVAADGDADGSETVPGAQQQVENTLAALTEALPDDPARETSTGKPKNEMLKEVLVAATQNSRADRERRLKWNDWLLRLFSDQPETGRVLLRGTIMLIQLRRNRPGEERPRHPASFPITLRTITEPIIAELLRDAESPEEPPETDGDSGPPEPSPTPPVGGTNPQTTHTPPETSAPSRPEVTPDPQTDLPLEIERNADAIWPPAPNALGLIGLEQPTRRLTEAMDVCMRFGRRFADKLLVGPPGVGKTTIAEALSQRLFAQPPVRFSGADLGEARQLVDALVDRGFLPRRRTGRVAVGRCLVFIDEVHAVSGPVQTWLLSATDDARITTHQGCELDFSAVSFIAATTDRGRLLPPLRTRFEIVDLPPYTLEELAAIVCHHGQQQFSGYVLPRPVCMEIAARCRCSPREAVRCLQGELFNYVATRLPQHEPPSTAAVGEAITLPLVIEFFTDKGLDSNGLDDRALRCLRHLDRHDSASEAALRQALQIYDPVDFRELEDYLRRLGLVEIRGSRRLTGDGRRYLREPFDLRARISRQSGTNN